MSRSGVVRCLVAALLFGGSAPAASKLADDMPVFVLAGLLYVGAGLGVLPAVVRARPSTVALRREWPAVCVAVVAGGAVGPVLLVAGLARTSAASASILLNLELAATVVIAAAVFHEHLGRRVIVGAGLVTLAGVVLVWEPGADFSVGAGLIAAACVAWGLDNTVTAGIDQLTPEQVVLLKGAIAGVANLALGVVIAGGTWPVTGGELLAALAIGAVGYGASIVLWVKGAREVGAARGQVIFATAPFVGALTAWVILGETVSNAQLVAIGIAGVGVAISFGSAHEHNHVHEPTEHEHEHTHPDPHHAHRHDDPEERRHSHRHRHGSLRHAHPHVPDLHHHHAHTD